MSKYTVHACIFYTKWRTSLIISAMDCILTHLWHLQEHVHHSAVGNCSMQFQGPTDLSKHLETLGEG